MAYRFKRRHNFNVKKLAIQHLFPLTSNWLLNAAVYNQRENRRKEGVGATVPSTPLWGHFV